MKFKKPKKSNVRRRYIMAKPIQDVSIGNLLITEIENNSSNDWDELCNKCSSLIKDAKMTDEEIDKIVNKSKNGEI